MIMMSKIVSGESKIHAHPTLNSSNVRYLVFIKTITFRSGEYAYKRTKSGVQNGYMKSEGRRTANNSRSVVEEQWRAYGS